MPTTDLGVTFNTGRSTLDLHELIGVAVSYDTTVPLDQARVSTTVALEFETANGITTARKCRHVPGGAAGRRQTSRPAVHQVANQSGVLRVQVEPTFTPPRTSWFTAWFRRSPQPQITIAVHPDRKILWAA